MYAIQLAKAQDKWGEPETAPTQNVRQCFAALIQSRAEEYGHREALSLFNGVSPENFTYKELAEQTRACADALIEKGLSPHDRIAILSESRPRWGVAFFSIVSAGAIVLPLDPTQSEEELLAILTDARPRMLLVSAQYTDLAGRLQSQARTFDHIFSIEPEAIATRFKSIDALKAVRTYARGRYLPTSPAVLSYTSGTMGNPKGVLTSYGNLISQVNNFRRLMHIDSDTRCVSILPLNHLFELTTTFLGVLNGGGKVCYANSLMPGEIVAAMNQQKVTCMVVVPLFLKLIAKNIRTEAARQAKWKHAVFKAFLLIAPTLPVYLRRKLFQQVHARFGGALKYFVCGGAPLDIELIRFFEALGINIYQGYGMAEASPVIATNTIDANKPGSVGRPLPGVEVAIEGSAGHGEILTRGPNIMNGYFNQPGLSREIIDADGWLHTGDIGYFDNDGYLFINGRKKNIIVLGSGKKVHPEELEAILFDHPAIKEGCIFGIDSDQGLTAGSEEICAVVVPADELQQQYADHDPRLMRQIEIIIGTKSRRLASWKKPAKIVVRRSDLPKTATRKVKRQVVKQQIVAGGYQ
jgi:long-chain acyl-CoA synthetase